MKTVSLLFLSFLLALSISAQEKSNLPTQRVGLPLLLEDIYLKGPLLEPVPRKDREMPLIVRLVTSKPAQDGFRYTFEVQGLEPGEYDLGNFLKEQAAESGVSTHLLPLVITTELPPGLTQPAELKPTPAPRIGGYRAFLWIFGFVWLAGLVGLFYSSREKVEAADSGQEAPTLANRLKPLLSKASQGKLAAEEQARLERLILAHWRERIPEVSNLPPAQSLALLREHPEASPLLLKLEHWLHAPASNITPEEIEVLLEPYQI